MYKLTISMFLLMVIIFPSMSAGERQIKISTVTYSSGSDTISSFLAQPEGTGPFPALVVIHEWWGINDQIKDVTKKFAQEGYVALAVDLYRGEITTDAGEARKLSQRLPKSRAIQDMLAALSYLQKQPIVIKNKIGSIGWCMGGGYSLQMAINSSELAACVIYYGRLETDEEQLKRITSPVIGFFGEEDSAIPVESVKSFQETMKNLGKKVEIHIYPGAGHAFANPTRSSAYRPKATEDAWSKTLTFLQESLGKP